MSDAGSTYRAGTIGEAGAAALRSALGNLEVTIASGDALDVRRFQVSEKLSSLFEVHLVAVSANPDIDFEAAIGQPMSFTIRFGQDRVWTGVCNHLQSAQRADATAPKSSCRADSGDRVRGCRARMT